MTGARAALVVLSACGPTPGSDAPVPPDVVDADGDGVPAGEDCADGDADIRPGADERCNGLDDDCDGEIDEDAVDADPWFPDRDGDGFGAEDGEILACTRPDGTLDIAGDCDDTTATVNPDRPESCNGRDDDCDGEVDEPGAAGEQTHLGEHWMSSTSSRLSAEASAGASGGARTSSTARSCSSRCCTAAACPAAGCALSASSPSRES